MYGLETIDAKLALQLAIDPGKPNTRASFWDFVINMQLFHVYLAMLGGQLHITMVHTPGVYYSIKASTGAYQGKVMAFVGDRRATKEPNPVCGNAINNYGRFVAYYSNATHQALCGHQELTTATPWPFQYQTSLQYQMSWLISSELRARQSHHTTFLQPWMVSLRAVANPRPQVGVYLALVHGGGTGRAQWEKQSVPGHNPHHN